MHNSELPCRSNEEQRRAKQSLWNSSEEKQRHGTDQQGTAIAARKRGDERPGKAKAQQSSGMWSVASELNCIDRRRKERNELSLDTH